MKCMPICATTRSTPVLDSSIQCSDFTGVNTGSYEGGGGGGVHNYDTSWCSRRGQTKMEAVREQNLLKMICQQVHFEMCTNTACSPRCGTSRVLLSHTLGVELHRTPPLSLATYESAMDKATVHILQLRLKSTPAESGLLGNSKNN